MVKMLLKDRQAVARGKRCELAMAFTPADGDIVSKLFGGADAPEGYIAGWASTPDLDLYNHKVMGGAFSEAIKTRGLRGPRAIKLLIGHNWEKHAGEIKVLEYRGDRLWIEAQLNLEISYVKDAYLAAKMIGGTNFSVGFMLQDYEFKEADDNEYLQINRGDLFEVSVVPFPGNEDATMTFVKDASAEGDDEDDVAPATIAEFEKALVASGLVKSRNDARAVTQVVKTCAGLFKAKEEPAAPPTKTAPVLDAEKLTELTSLVAKMKAVIAPVAT